MFTSRGEDIYPIEANYKITILNFNLGVHLNNNALKHHDLYKKK